MKNKRYILLFIVFFLISATSYADNVESDKLEVLKLKDDDHYIGNTKAKVTIITYSSLSCPGCAYFHENLLPKIKKEYIDSGKLLFIFRDYQNNEPALYGATLANCFENSYFELIDILFKSQIKWAFRKDFKKMLKNIGRLSGFSAEKISKCFEDKSFSDQLQMKAFKDMKTLNLNQTPTIYINQEFIIANNYDDYVKIIDKYLNK